MNPRLFVAALALVGATGCSVLPPVPIYAGDLCFRCRRSIPDARMGAQVIDPAGRAFKFKTPGCLATYLRENHEPVAAIWVTDHRTGKMVQARHASFVRAAIGEGRDKTEDFLAFRSEADARSFAVDRPVLRWDDLLAAGN